LGWALAGEAITTRILIAAAVIIGAVALIVADQSRSTGNVPTTGEFAAVQKADGTSDSRERRTA
jgi:predicted anti-sigma-YlaC factor YlaD